MALKYQNLNPKTHVGCLFVPFFLLVIVLSVLPRFTASDYPFWYLQTFLMPYTVCVIIEFMFSLAD